MKKIFGVLGRIFLFFAGYASFFERKVDKFFSKLKSSDSPIEIKKRLLELMQKDLITVNIWLEKKFKGYLYLKRGVRARLYRNAAAIVRKFEKVSFDEFGDEVKAEELRKLIDHVGVVYPVGNDEKLWHLYKIMMFLRPGPYYSYLKTSSFGKLLVDPDSGAKLEGDCNQIVTLYMYLYSLRFPIEDLRIKLLPEHVCLHFRGVDVEATNGTFQKYVKGSGDVGEAWLYETLPATEIISTNLLDLADFREDLQRIPENVIVKSAELAYAISSLRPLVEKNLAVSYRNLVALNLEKKNFSAASFYAGKLGDSVLKKEVRKREGYYYYETDQLDSALRVFDELGDLELKKACYGKKYNKLAAKVAGVKTVSDAKRFVSVYREMLELASKMGDSKLAESVRETLGKI